MSPELASQTYTCQCKGCGSGGSFEAAPANWWHEKGLSPPRNCPSCRAWIKNQIDGKAPCATCRWEIPVSAKRKISFHKREGKWHPPVACTRCAADPTWAEQSAKARGAVRERKKQDKDDRQKPDLVARLKAKGAFPSQLDSIRIAGEMQWWETTFKNYAKEGRQSLYVHIIGRHGNEIAKSAGVGTDQQIVAYLAMLANSNDSSRVVQFRQRNRSIVKLDTMTKVAIVVDIRDPAAPEPITAFPPEKDRYILEKINEGRWKI